MPLNLPATATPPIQPQNPYEQLRLQQIFGGTPPNQGAPTPMGPAGSPITMGMESPIGEMGGYQPETTATDRLNELLGAYPEGKRGWLQKIALGMIGAGDPRLAASLMQQPTREQADWQEQIGPAQFAAGQERLSNVNMRQIADLISSGQREDIKIGQAGERIEISRAAQELDEWKAEHPNMQLKTRADGMIVGINPADPTKVVESGVQSGDLSDQEKEDARVEAAVVAEKGRVGRAATAEQGRVSRAVTAETGRVSRAKQRELDVRGRPKTTGAVELERGRRVANNAREVLARHPEWKRYVTIRDNEVTVKPIGTGLFSKDLKKPLRDQIVREIFGDGGEIETGEVMEKPIPDGSGTAISRDGGITWQRK